MTGSYHDPDMPRILVVEDEPRIASFLSRALVDNGFRVDTAEEGGRALQLARTGQYDLVLLDLLLPGLDGYSVLRGIMEHRPEQRVFVLSGISDVDSKVHCLELGATEYMTKPFSLAELEARVRARLREPLASPPDRFVRSGPVVLDMVRRAAEGERGAVGLTQREFAVLHQLILKDGDVCTRQQLMRDVWGLGFANGSNVVDVYVGRLRAKLGDGVVETVRDVGYRLNVT